MVQVILLLFYQIRFVDTDVTFCGSSVHDVETLTIMPKVSVKLHHENKSM